jgi:hypothetical protein
MLESHASKQGNIIEMNAMFGGEKSEDVEMGRIRAATRMSVVSTDIRALPPMKRARLWKIWERKT